MFTLISRRPAKASAFCFLAGLALYLPTLRFGFLWDDTEFILQNAFLADPLNAFRAFAHFFSTVIQPVAGGARPAWVASLVWDHWLWALSPAGYHFTNVLLHAVNCALAFALARRALAGGDDRDAGTAGAWALFAALAFAVHPIHVESVSAIGFRTDLLALLFIQLATLCLWRAGEGSRAARAASYAASLAAYAIALLSKEVAAPLPLLWVAHDFFARPAAEARRRLLLYVPFAIVLAGFLHFHDRRFEYDLSNSISAMASLPAAALSSEALAADDAKGPESVYRDRAANAFTMAVVFARYVGKILVPAGLCADYDVRVRRSPLDPAVALGFLVLALAAVLVRLFARRDPALAWGLLWFYVFLAPVSNVLPIANLMAERYLYVPSLGFLIFLAAVLRRAVRGRPDHRLLTAALAGVLLVWSLKTVTYSQVWRDGGTLFSETIRSAPGNFRPWYNAGLAFQRQGLWDKAIYHYRQAAERGPHRKEIFVNMGRCYEEVGDEAAAEQSYRYALQVDPRDPLALVNLGHLRRKHGDLDGALEFYLKAYETAPLLALATRAAAGAYYDKGEWHNAGVFYDKTWRIEPEDSEALYHMGECFLRAYDPARGREAWGVYLARWPDSPRRADIERALSAAPK